MGEELELGGLNSVRGGQSLIARLETRDSWRVRVRAHIRLIRQAVPRLVLEPPAVGLVISATSAATNCASLNRQRSPKAFPWRLNDMGALGFHNRGGNALARLFTSPVLRMKIIAEMVLTAGNKNGSQSLTKRESWRNRERRGGGETGGVSEVSE